MIINDVIVTNKGGDPVKTVDLLHLNGHSTNQFNVYSVLDNGDCIGYIRARKHISGRPNPRRKPWSNGRMNQSTSEIEWAGDHATRNNALRSVIGV